MRTVLAGCTEGSSWPGGSDTTAIQAIAASSCAAFANSRSISTERSTRATVEGAEVAGTCARATGQLPGIAHFTTPLDALSDAEVPENCTATGVAPGGMLRTTHPVTHCPADNPELFAFSSESDARGPENWEPEAPVLAEAVEPLLNSASKSDPLGPLLEPCGPAQVVATIASHVWPADGVFAN